MQVSQRNNSTWTFQKLQFTIKERSCKFSGMKKPYPIRFLGFPQNSFQSFICRNKHCRLHVDLLFEERKFHTNFTFFRSATCIKKFCSNFFRYHFFPLVWLGKTGRFLKLYICFKEPLWNTYLQIPQYL